MRRVLSRTDISAKAKGIYMFLASSRVPIGHKDLPIFFKEGRDAISTGVKELTENGLVVQEYIRGDGGRIKGIKLAVVDKENVKWPKNRE